MPDDEMFAARARLAEAIADVDRLLCARDDEPREPDELLTHWAVVYSVGQFGAHHEGTQVSVIRSDGLTYWMCAGLLSAEAHAALAEPWRDGE